MVLILHTVPLTLIESHLSPISILLPPIPFAGINLILVFNNELLLVGFASAIGLIIIYLKLEKTIQIFISSTMKNILNVIKYMDLMMIVKDLDTFQLQF